MLEAATKPWQVLNSETGTRRATFIAAASQMGVGVFASGPLGEGQLFQNKRVQVGSIKLPHCGGVHSYE